MLSPRLTNCPECANIPSLLRKIDCKLAELGNNLYNNISYMLNKPIPADDILQLIGYRRILQYKYINPNYAGIYTINMIASRVIRLTVGCVSRCNTPLPCIEVPCNVTIVPNPTTTTTTSYTPRPPYIPPTSSTSSTTTSSTTLCPGCTTTSTSSTSTTSTSSSTTTSSTTINNATIIQKLTGLKIETIYIRSQSDLNKLPSNYVHPCPFQISAHTCDRGFFEVTGNGVYIGDSLMNNLNAGGPGVETQSGKFTCVDYSNYPAALTGGTWTGEKVLSGGSRYSKMIISGQQAIDIASAYPGHCSIQFELVPTMITYNVSCDVYALPHENVTWTRITKPDGTIIYNDCPIGNIATVNICI